MNNENKKKRCQGCRNDIYNHGAGAKDTKECWSLKSAKPVKKKKVHINDIPPWKNQDIVSILSCYNKPQFVFVDPDTEY